MTLLHVDTSAGVDGNGSLANPYNTAASLSPSNGDSILFKTGTSVPVSTLPAGWLSFETLTVGAYGTGDKPILTGGVVRADWTEDAPNGVWYRAYGSNIVGNITEDGTPMDFVAFTVNIATTAALMAAGSFSFDYTGFVLYIKPSSGAPASHVYVVSESMYCITSGTEKSGLILRDMELRSASRHAILLFNKTDLLIDGVEVNVAGGIREGSSHLGNGADHFDPAPATEKSTA